MMLERNKRATHPTVPNELTALSMPHIREKLNFWDMR